MKKNKIISFIFIVFMSAFIFNAEALASTSISIKSSSTVTINNTITTTVTLSSSEPLGSWNFVVGYDSSKLTLLDNASQRVVGYGDGNIKSKSYTFKFKAKALGNAKVYIDSASYYTWNEVAEGVSKGSKTITIKEKYVPPVVTYSKNNYLSSLEIEGYSLEPKFNKNTLEYTVKLPRETYNAKVVAKTEDKKASVNGIGDVTLIDGENKLEVKVTAENGNIKTYIIKAIVEEPNPIIVNIDGKEYTVIRKKDGITAPTNYKETTIDIQGESVLAFYGEITKYNLVALKDTDGNINFYTYDLNNEKFELYKELKFNSINVYPYNISDDKIIKNFEKSTMTINGIEVDALKDNKNYPIIYGMNLNNGEISYYTYDAKENTLQRYNNDVTLKLEKESKKFFYVSLALGALCILELIIMIIILAAKNNKNNKKLEELGKTMKFNAVKLDSPKTKKEIKKEEKQKIKDEKEKVKQEKKKLKEQKKNKIKDMDTL